MVDSPHRHPARDGTRPRGPMTDNIKGGKGSVFYRAHSYHTKVPVEGLIQLVEYYTDPGDVVLDPFCGSGQTGVAAVLTGRHAVLSDLSPAAVHIARGYTGASQPRSLPAGRIRATRRARAAGAGDVRGAWGTDRIHGLV